MNGCLIVCETRPNADRLYKYLLNHLASFGVPLRTERRIRSVEILTTEIRVVSAHEYYFKCQTGFRGKVIYEDDAWRMIDEDKKRLTNKKEKSMKLQITHEENESLNNLTLASAIYDAFKSCKPEIDLGVVGHLIESQAEYDSRTKGKCEGKRS